MPDINGFEFYDTDGDGYRETGLADSNADGFSDVSAHDTNVDAVVDMYLWDSNGDGIFDSMTLDTDGGMVLDRAAVEINQDGVIDALVDPSSHQVPDVQAQPQVTLSPNTTIVGPSNSGGYINDLVSMIPHATPRERGIIEDIIDTHNDAIDVWVGPDEDDHDW